ncbi:MAG: beta-ketoacyl reductase, partial [Pseudomonadota bacterium]
EAAGASVHCISADVAEEAAMRAALAAYEAEARPPVRAVVHAAGRVDSVLAHELTSERFDAVMAPKLAGARVLDRLFPDLDLFVAFSSIATVFRPTGMANYAAANAALEGLVASRLARGQTALAIAWGVWPGVGMHRDLGDWGEGDLERRGILPLEPDGAEALFGWLCRQGSSAAVLRIDGDLFAARQRHRTDPLFAEIIAEGAGGASDTAAALANAAGPEERRAILEQAVRASLGAVLKMAPAEVDAEKPLGAMGLNSLMAMELRNRLERALDRPLPATLAWNHPTLRALIAYLDREAAASAEPPATAPQAVPGPAPSASPEAVDPLALDDLLDGLSEQSDADLVAALRAGGGRT